MYGGIISKCENYMWSDGEFLLTMHGFALGISFKHVSLYTNYK